MITIIIMMIMIMIMIMRIRLTIRSRENLSADGVVHLTAIARLFRILACASRVVCRLL